VRQLFVPVPDILLKLDDLAGQRGAAVLQGGNGVLVSFFVHNRQFKRSSLESLWRLRHNTGSLVSRATDIERGRFENVSPYQAWLL
jgi:hypothetical protein